MYNVIKEGSIKDRILNSFDLTEDKINDLKDGTLGLLNSNNADLKELMFRLVMAKMNKEKVFIVGDYDADGICSTTIMVNTLRQIGIECNYYIPSRVEEGYGLSKELVQRAIEYKFNLLITVDNGVKSLEAIEYAKDKIDLMIIDHHEYEDRPDCKYFLHPNILEPEFDQMCASGLALLVANRLCEDPYNEILGMIGTVADMVPVFFQNRRIIKNGINKLKELKPLTITSLLSKQDITYDSISFDIAPKINAVSRIGENVNLVVKYLLEKDDDVILKGAESINKINNYRKDKTQVETELARISTINSNIVLSASDKFSEGLCGIIAARLVDEYKKPALVLAYKDGIYKGSARSVDGIDLYSYLDSFKNYATFGGHAKACGLSINEDDYNGFKAFIDKNPLPTKIEYSENIISINDEELNLKTIEFLESLKPFGEGFKEPLFIYTPYTLNRPFMIKGIYPKWSINDDVEAISFKTLDNLNHAKSLIGNLTTSTFKDKTKINIRVCDLL